MGSGAEASINLAAEQGLRGLEQTSCIQLSTDLIPPGDRLDYWRSTALRRMEPDFSQRQGAPFRARLTRLLGPNRQLVEHAADSLLVVRTREHCRRDECDDICVGLVTEGVSAHVGERPVRAGEIRVLDCARPVHMQLSRHRTISLSIRRTQVRDVLGLDPGTLASLRLHRRGIAALLQSHMQAIVSEAAHLSAAERTLALDVATEMAFAAIQQVLASAVDADGLALGVHGAALALIGHECTDPELTPLRVAAALGCSRAALYRIFAGSGAGVAGLIWSARLERAHDMLRSAACADLPISEIAFRSGFVDHPTFGRMFKRRYGMTPRDARAGTGSATS